jgi:acetyl esterase/lipase
MKTLTLEQYVKNFVALIILSLIIPVSALPQGQRKANTDNINRKWLDVAYATKSPAQKLDVYIPDEGEGPFPVILSIHGGPAFTTSENLNKVFVFLYKYLKN